MIWSFQTCNNQISKFLTWNLCYRCWFLAFGPFEMWVISSGGANNFITYEHKMTTISLIIVEVVILSKTAVILSVARLLRTVIFSQLEICHVLNWSATKNQHRKSRQKYNSDMFEFIASFILWIILKVGQWFPFKSQSTNLAKYQGHCYAKREEAVWSLLFLNNNDPVFLHPAFCKK